MRFTEQEEYEIISGSGLENLIGGALLVEVLRRYDEPHRHYHNRQHVLNMLAHVDSVCQHYPDKLLVPYTRDEMSIATLFHDAVYDIGPVPQSNERNSAGLFEMSCCNMPLDSRERIRRLIMLTASHGKLKREGVCDAEALFLDCDLATFAEPRWAVALETDRAVTREMLQVYTLEQVAAGRKAFLGGLLENEHIYLSRHFESLWETQARRNIERFFQGARWDSIMVTHKDNA